jgi:hypothetical protein
VPAAWEKFRAFRRRSDGGGIIGESVEETVVVPGHGEEVRPGWVQALGLINTNACFTAALVFRVRVMCICLTVADDSMETSHLRADAVSCLSPVYPSSLNSDRK